MFSLVSGTENREGSAQRGCHRLRQRLSRWNSIRLRPTCPLLECVDQLLCRHGRRGVAQKRKNVCHVFIGKCERLLSHSSEHLLDMPKGRDAALGPRTNPHPNLKSIRDFVSFVLAGLFFRQPSVRSPRSGIVLQPVNGRWFDSQSCRIGGKAMRIQLPAIAPSHDPSGNSRNVLANWP